MAVAVSQSISHYPGLEDARELLKQLSDFDNLTPEISMGILLNLMQVIEPCGKNAQEMTHALFTSLQAIQIPFSDPVMESWASIIERAPWIAAEFAHLENSLNTETETRPPSPQLQEYRSRFRSDPDGWPIESILNATEARETLLKETAAKRQAIYELYEATESFRPRNGAQMRSVSDLTASLLLSTLSPTVYQEIAKLRQQTANQSAPPQAWELYGAQLRIVFEQHPELLFHNLSHLDKPRLTEVLGHLRFGIFEGADHLPDGFLEQHQAIDSLWQKRSTSFASFSASEIMETLTRQHSYLSAIFYDETVLQYGVTLCGRDCFLPQTKDKLARINPTILPNRLDVYAWQYFSSGNPLLYSQLGDLHVDWYSLYQEIVSDLVISQGKEQILGIVTQDNPAERAHQRVGYEALPTRLLFRSDHGTEGKIIAYSPYDRTTP